MRVADDGSRWRGPDVVPWLSPQGRMGPPLPSFAADAHDCIMVGVLGPTEYKVVARLLRARKAGSPLIVFPTAARCRRARSRQGVAWRGQACCKIDATANLDSSCARRGERTAGRDEETGFRIEQRNRPRKDAPPLVETPRQKKSHTRLPRRCSQWIASGDRIYRCVREWSLACRAIP